MPVSDYTLELKLIWNWIGRKKTNLKFSELCFDWSKCNLNSISICSLIQASRWS